MKKKKVLTLIATLTASTLTAITITNRILCKLATSDHYLDEDEGEYYDWRFGKIFYKKEGSGTPLLLVHTLDAAASSAEWKYLMDKLVENHTVYVLDLLGCGKSDKPQITYTNYLYVQLISDFIRNIIGQKTDVIASGNASFFCHHGLQYGGFSVPQDHDSESGDGFPDIPHAQGQFPYAAEAAGTPDRWHTALQYSVQQTAYFKETGRDLLLSLLYQS